MLSQSLQMTGYAIQFPVDSRYQGVIVPIAAVSCNTSREHVHDGKASAETGSEAGAEAHKEGQVGKPIRSSL